MGYYGAGAVRRDPPPYRSPQVGRCLYSSPLAGGKVEGGVSLRCSYCSRLWCGQWREDRIWHTTAPGLSGATPHPTLPHKGGGVYISLPCGEERPIGSLRFGPWPLWFGQGREDRIWHTTAPGLSGATPHPTLPHKGGGCSYSSPLRGGEANWVAPFRPLAIVVRTRARGPHLAYYGAGAFRRDPPPYPPPQGGRCLYFAPLREGGAN